ncbi:metallophosphoesterase [Erwinia persicina]|uniref:metallophosphoesterase n=1 Tax=Erwinia persicina TaxID=55211 RepID=UPI0021044547|nr:metallophosphoesterase [Erwinia persicina]MCQ4107109.1 metallophosphoesterase [Erwinia persicina]UTX13027.1 metallophosphoesterase [Erwinia persicina]
MSIDTLPHPLSDLQHQALGAAAVMYQPPRMRATHPADRTLRFGLMADPQYADVDADVPKNLYYRHALHKLPKAIAALNRQPLDFVVTLGDMVDRHWPSYQALLPLYETLHHPHAMVIGNHDAQVISDRLTSAHTPPAGLPKSYYQFRLAGYRFIIFDGNDISLYCNQGNGDDRQQAKAMLADLIARQQPQGQLWNGAVGGAQFAWIEEQLKQARLLGETVVVFGHYPLAPHTGHILWNGGELADLLCRYQVRACFTGHDHRGGYVRRENTDFIIMKGMLDGAEDVPFAVVELLDGVLTVRGYGSEISRILTADIHESDAFSSSPAD